jgi:hypothetical protein
MCMDTGLMGMVNSANAGIEQHTACIDMMSVRCIEHNNLAHVCPMTPNACGRGSCDLKKWIQQSRIVP